MSPWDLNGPFTNDPSGAGYILNDGLNRYLYDAEWRICAAASSPIAGIATYTGYLYDADGTRVAHPFPRVSTDLGALSFPGFEKGGVYRGFRMFSAPRCPGIE